VPQQVTLQTSQAAGRCCSDRSSVVALILKPWYRPLELQLCLLLRLLLLLKAMVVVVSEVYAKSPRRSTSVVCCLMVLEPPDLLYRAL